MPQAVQPFLLNPRHFQYSVKFLSQIDRLGVASAFVGHNGRIFHEIRFSAQVLDHLDCRPVQRHCAPTSGAFGFADFDFSTAFGVGTVALVYFFDSLPYCQRFLFKVDVAVQQAK